MELMQVLQWPTREWRHPRRLEDFVTIAEFANIAIFFKDPKTLFEVLARNEAQKWQATMEEKKNSLKKNNTWVLSKLSKDCKCIGDKWVFWPKKNTQGQVVHHKARFVAKGYAQKHDVEFNDTFARMVKFTSIIVLLIVTTIKDLEIYQVDFKNAFLNGNLD